MILHLALILALNAAAAPATEKLLVLKTLHTFASDGVIDPNFTLLATPTKSSVNLWSLDTGRQVGRIELPTIENRHENDYHEVAIHSVRPDLKALLVSVRHLFYNPKYTPDGGMPNMASALERLYLASTENEKKLTLLWTIEGRCVYLGGIQSYHCPATNSNGTAHIADDRPEVVAGVRMYADHGTVIDRVFDLTGKKLFENKFLYADWDRAKKNYVPVSLELPFSIVMDDQSCSVIRGDKRVSFLEGCVKNDQPELSRDKKKVISRWNAVYKTWDAESGALTARLDLKVPAGWSTGYSAFGVWSQSADGRIVAVLLTKGHEPGQIWNAASGGGYCRIGPERMRATSFCRRTARDFTGNISARQPAT